MNSQKIGCQEDFHQRHNGLISDRSFDYANLSSQCHGYQQPWNTGSHVEAPRTIEGGSELHRIVNLGAHSSRTIMDRFSSPASAFYATERYMGFPQYERGIVGNPHMSVQCSKTYDSQFPLGKHCSTDMVDQSEASFELRNTLQSLAKSQFSSNQYFRSSELPYEYQSSKLPGSKQSSIDQYKLLSDDAVPAGRPLLSALSEGTEDCTNLGSSYSAPFAQLSYYSKQEKSLRFSSGAASICSGNPISNGASKTRIRWTQDLHEKFVKCVNCLGGSEKATPKAILKLMDSDSLTIFHVKSHLQKYRFAKYMPDSAEGKFESSTSMGNATHQLDKETGLQIKEALQFQLDVQRRLHEQLEIQRKLQVQIEEQGKKLKLMFDEQQKTNQTFMQAQDEPPMPFSIEDVEVLITESSGNMHFPSKIS